MVRALLLCALALGTALAHAENLGTIGPTYPIAEQNLLDHIMATLRQKERSGELQRLQELAQARATQTVRSPKPVPGLSRAATARTYYFDPTFTLDRNITDENGQLLFAAGLRKNPLDVVSLSKHLLFFDARDPRQVARAKELIETYQGRVKPILVGGSYLDLMKAWNRPVFYDQEGALVRKLGIQAVPAIVSQEGSRLRIDEVAIK
ncbi:MAG: type-F conjugative transfer system protein TraW [Burkholderiales bacterium]|nr:MAG: type-F conjugative transfer system protein TraW [Burkholderiales bacterium]